MVVEATKRWTETQVDARSSYQSTDKRARRRLSASPRIIRLEIGGRWIRDRADPATTCIASGTMPDRAGLAVALDLTFAAVSPARRRSRSTTEASPPDSSAWPSVPSRELDWIAGPFHARARRSASIALAWKRARPRRSETTTRRRAAREALGTPDTRTGRPITSAHLHPRPGFGEQRGSPWRQRLEPFDRIEHVGAAVADPSSQDAACACLRGRREVSPSIAPRRCGPQPSDRSRRERRNVQVRAPRPPVGYLRGVPACASGLQEPRVQVASRPTARLLPQSVGRRPSR